MQIFYISGDQKYYSRAEINSIFVLLNNKCADSNKNGKSCGERERRRKSVCIAYRYVGLKVESKKHRVLLKKQSSQKQRARSKAVKLRSDGKKMWPFTFVQALTRYSCQRCQHRLLYHRWPCSRYTRSTDREAPFPRKRNSSDSGDWRTNAWE